MSLYLPTGQAIYFGPSGQPASSSSACIPSMSGSFSPKRRNFWPKKVSSSRYYGKRPIISHDFHPGFNWNSYDRPKMSQGWQYNGQLTNHESVYGPFQPPYAGFSPPQSRSFEELQVERSYLINSLQREDSKATELLKKIGHLQDSCHDPSEGPVHGNVKKQLGHFKSRLYQCTKQEKRILARLGQVTYEIQSKERWSRIENERMQQRNCYEFEQMRLNAAGSEFEPNNAYPPQWPIQPVYDSHYYGEYPQVMPSYGDVPQWQSPMIQCESNEPHELPCLVSSPLSTRLRSASMINLALASEKVKRLSLPELSVADSEGDASGDDDREYIGYYIRKPSR